MDGIYSAAREIGERELFDVAQKLAHDALPHGCKLFVKKALIKARQVGHQRNLAPWRIFTYLCRATHSPYAVGAALPEIGLWPVAMIGDRANEKDLDKAALLADKIFPAQGARLTPEQRVNALNLTDPEAERQLIQVLRATERLPRMEALASLAQEPDLWVNRLRPGLFEEQTLGAIHWVSWRGNTTRPLAWSGLSESNEPSGGTLNQRRLMLLLDPDGDNPQERARLEVRWKVEPDTLAKGAVDYLVEVRTELDVLAEKSVSHTGKSLQKATFTQDDFENIDESDVFEPQVVIRALSEPTCETATESFILCFGQPDDQPVKSSAGRIYPTLALAAAHVVPNDHDLKALAKSLYNRQIFDRDKKGFITCRWNHKVGRVYCPPLLAELAKDWGARDGALGRWRVRVRADGASVGKAAFIAADVDAAAERLIQASQKMARWMEDSQGPLGILYDDSTVLNDYVLAAHDPHTGGGLPGRALPGTDRLAHPSLAGGLATKLRSAGGLSPPGKRSPGQDPAAPGKCNRRLLPRIFARLAPRRNFRVCRHAGFSYRGANPRQRPRTQGHRGVDGPPARR
jgi:hypothetical protein